VCAGWRRRAWWYWAGGILFLVVLGPSGSHTLGEYGAGWLVRFIPLVATVAIFILFFRNNPLAYLTATFGSVAVPPIIDLLSQPSSFYRWNGVLLCILVAAVLLWLLAPSRKPRPAYSLSSLDSGGA
jgi:hypothetical protein